MAMPKQWKVVGASVAVAGLGLGGLFGAAAADDSGPSDSIRLRDASAISDTDNPKAVDGAADDRQGSPDGESLDSPLQSPDDSPPGQDSVDTVDSPDPVSIDSPVSVDSPDPAPAPAPAPVVAPAPAPAPAPPPPPPPPPAPAGDSWDSPDSVSVDSPS